MPSLKPEDLAPVRVRPIHSFMTHPQTKIRHSAHFVIVYEIQDVPERNPLALHANYEKRFIANSLSTGFRSS
jgi:hypothetical protein